MKALVEILVDFVIALLLLPVFLALALLLGGVFGLVGGGASAFVAVWPVLLFYHDRYLTTLLPPSWSVGIIRRAQAYVDFHSDPNRRP